MKKTHFGLTSIFAGSVCALSLLANYSVSQMDISQEAFNILNNLTTLSYCGLTQATIVLGILGLMRKNDSKRFSWVGIILAIIPFLFVFGQFLISFLG